MVKLTRILKSEYRDDAGSKRSRKLNRKKPSPEVLSNASFRDDATQGTAREELSLPPELLKILATDPTGQTQEEKRDPVAHNLTTGENPHHFALTRAAQMALRTLPSMGADADDTSSMSSTMALIDSIVKTSDDPTLIEALQAMIVDASGRPLEQRETLALVAESIMEKKAAKEALQRAVLAESRLQESLKKCGPDVVGDAAAVVAAVEGTDAPSTSTPTPTGLFNRINKSFTGTSQKGLRRMSLGKSKAKDHKSKNKSSKKEVDDSNSTIEDPEGNLAPGELEEPTGKPIAEDPPVMADEGRDDVEQAPGERESYVNDGSIFAGPGTAAPRRMNKYKNIASIEPDTLVLFTRTQSHTTHEADQSIYATGYTSNYNFGEASTSAENGVEEAESLLVDEESGSGSEADETEGEDFTETEEDDAEDPNFAAEEEEKIEYTIFELESILSMSTHASSVFSGSSCASSDGHHSDNEKVFTEGEEEAEGTCDEASCHEATGDEGEESGAESGSGEESDDSSDDDDDDDGGFLLSLCRRLESSFDVDANSDEDDDSRSERRSRRKSSRRQSRRREQEVPSVLRCVSGYFLGDGEDVEVEEKEKRHRRRRRRRRRSRSRRHRRHRERS